MARSMDKQTMEFEFFGQRIPLKTQEDSEFAREVMEMVQVRLKDAQRRSKTPAAHQVALLALFDVAEEYLKAKRRFSDQRKKFNEKSSELIHLLEAR